MKLLKKLQKNKNVVFIIAVLVVLSFFLIPLTVVPIVQTIEWKGNNIDVTLQIDDFTERAVTSSLSHNGELSASLSTDQGRNAEHRSREGRYTFDFKSINVQEKEKVEFLYSGSVSVGGDFRGSPSASIDVGLKQGSKFIYQCSKGANFGGQGQLQDVSKTSSLFKIENLGGGFYRIETECGLETKLIQEPEAIIPYMHMEIHTSSSAYAHSASSSLQLLDIRKEEFKQANIPEIKEETEEISQSAEQQIELIADSSLNEEEQQKIITIISKSDSEKEQLTALLEKIKADKEKERKRNLYLMIGGIIILAIAVISYILTRKKKR